MVGNSEDSLRWMMMSGKRAVQGGPYLPVLMPTSGASTVSFRCLQKKKKKKLSMNHSTLLVVLQLYFSDRIAVTWQANKLF